MTIIKKKIIKGLPTKVEIRKPYHYYQDITGTYNENTTLNIKLKEFEGLNYTVDPLGKVINIEGKELWNRVASPNVQGIIAPLQTYTKTTHNLNITGKINYINNIASFFDNTDYIILGKIIPNTGKSWEMVAKIKTGDDVTTEQNIFVENNVSYYSRIGIAGGKFTFRISSTHTSSTNVTGEAAPNITTIQPNTRYWVKFMYESELQKYSVYSSLDNVTWNLERSVESSLVLTNYQWNLGSSGQKTYYFPFKGAIDLEETYVKYDNNVVWELQEETSNHYTQYIANKKGLAYDVVGSPTIVNNVVSNFSKSNYIYSPAPQLGSADTWEIMSKFKTGSDVSGAQRFYQFFMFSGADGRYGLTLLIEDNLFGMNASSDGSTWFALQKGSHTVQPDTTYWVKVTFDGSKYVLSYSFDGVDFINDITFESTLKLCKVYHQYIGIYSTDENVFRGEIDLNECYIRLDGVEVFGKNATTYEISKGLLYTTTGLRPALQQTLISNGSDVYVSEDGVPQGFYKAGLSDLDLFNTEDAFKDIYKLNYDTVGELKYKVEDNAVIVRGFDKTNSIIIPAFTKGYSSYEMVFRGRIYNQEGGELVGGDDGGTFFIQTASKKLSIYKSSTITGTTVIPINTLYEFKLVWDGTNSTWYSRALPDGPAYFDIPWVLEGTKNIDVFATSKKFIVGGPSSTATYYWKGEMDLLHCYMKVDGEYHWKPVETVKYPSSRPPSIGPSFP